MRKLATYEGVVKNGDVRLLGSVSIPEKTRVYVFVPDAESDQAAYIASPRLADTEQAKNFEKQVIDEATDASL
jgi:hypothetical protein